MSCEHVEVGRDGRKHDTEWRWVRKWVHSRTGGDNGGEEGGKEGEEGEEGSGCGGLFFVIYVHQNNISSIITGIEKEGKATHATPKRTVTIAPTRPPSSPASRVRRPVARPGAVAMRGSSCALCAGPQRDLGPRFETMRTWRIWRADWGRTSLSWAWGSVRRAGARCTARKSSKTVIYFIVPIIHVLA